MFQFVSQVRWPHLNPTCMRGAAPPSLAHWPLNGFGPDPPGWSHSTDYFACPKEGSGGWFRELPFQLALASRRLQLLQKPSTRLSSIPSERGVDAKLIDNVPTESGQVRRLFFMHRMLVDPEILRDLPGPCFGPWGSIPAPGMGFGGAPGGSSPCSSPWRQLYGIIGSVQPSGDSLCWTGDR